MRIALPPKRYDDPFDPKYDSIRHKAYFIHFEERAIKLPALKQACLEVEKGMGQQRAADEYGVDVRELRAYEWFLAPQKHPNTRLIPRYQIILDEAYKRYLASNADVPLKKCIEVEAKMWGVNPRHITDLWDSNPMFVPTVYQKGQNDQTQNKRVVVGDMVSVPHHSRGSVRSSKGP